MKIPNLWKKHPTLSVVLPIVLMILVSVAFIGIQGNMGSYQKIEQVYVLFWVILFLLLTMIAIGILLLVLILLKIPLFGITKERDVLETEPEEIMRMDDNERDELLQKLQEKKRKVEYMIDITKKRYYQREMDEESFREITRDHQKKLIDIETKIKEMEEQIEKLKKEKEQK